MDPFILQALISGGGAVLGGILGSAGTYLLAKKKLRHDAALHLYKKQIEACSGLLHKANELTVHILDGGYILPDHGERMDAFSHEVYKVQFYLPRQVLEALKTFWNEAKRFPARHNRRALISANLNLNTEARSSLRVEPIADELVSIPIREKEQPQKASSGHGGS